MSEIPPEAQLCLCQTLVVCTHNISNYYLSFGQLSIFLSISEQHFRKTKVTEVPTTLKGKLRLLKQTSGPWAAQKFFVLGMMSSEN